MLEVHKKALDEHRVSPDVEGAVLQELEVRSILLPKPP